MYIYTKKKNQQPQEALSCLVFFWSFGQIVLCIRWPCGTSIALTFKLQGAHIKRNHDKSMDILPLFCLASFDLFCNVVWYWRWSHNPIHHQTLPQCRPSPLPAQKHYQLLTDMIHVLEFDLLQCSETEKETQIITDQTVAFSI